MISALGNFDFLTMSRRPVGPLPKIAIESRAGVNGVAAWNTGTRGEVQTIETYVDVPTFGYAQTLADLYATVVGSLLPITYAGQTLPFVALVLSVEAQPEAIVLGVGGLSGVSRAAVRATWQIVTR